MPPLHNFSFIRQYSLQFNNMQDVRNEIRTFLEEQELSQTELAEQAGVSQPTVSRALHNQRERSTSQRQKLIGYIRAQARRSRRQHYAPGVTRVTNAFERIWDGSEAHARAVASVIDAMVDLRPAGKRRGKRGKQRSAPQRTPEKRRP